MPDLMIEVANFRQWAEAYPAERSGEWECDYSDWDRLYESVQKFIFARPIESWSVEELAAVLYAIARDNERQHLSWVIRSSDPEILLELAKAAAEAGEADATWQLAEELAQLGSCTEEVERLLILLVSDKNEYVRRRSLQALARLGSLEVEKLAIAEWQRPDEHQQWSRMNVLWILQRVGSPLLEERLEEAERDERPHLADYAKRLRLGLIDD